MLGTAMPLSLTDLGLGILLPAVISAVIVLLAGRLVRAERTRVFPATAFALATAAGLAALDLVPWQPESHWHWMPWLLMASAIPSCLPDKRGWLRLQWIGWLALIGAASVLLVPDWKDLIASQNVLRASLCCLAIVNAVTFAACVRNAAPTWVLRHLVIGTLLMSVLLLLSGSLLFSQIGLAGFGASCGLLFAEWRGAKMSVMTLAVPVSLFFAGMMLIAQVNSYSSVPAVAYLLCAVHPTVVGVCGRAEKRPRSFIRFCISELPAGVALAAVAWAAYAEYGPQ